LKNFQNFGSKLKKIRKREQIINTRCAMNMPYEANKRLYTLNKLMNRLAPDMISVCYRPVATPHPHHSAPVELLSTVLDHHVYPGKQQIKS
jgi:hypothetical protein